MAAPTRTLTEFLQHLGRVLPELEEGEVVLRCRQGDDVVVLSRPHWDAVVASLRLLADVRRAGTQGKTNEMTSPAWLGLPWLSLLALEDQEACVQELTTTALAAVESGKLRPLAEALDAWRATALATWDENRSRAYPGYDEEASIPLPRP